MIRLRGISFVYPGELEEVDRTAYIASKLREIVEDTYFNPMLRKTYESGFTKKLETYIVYLVNPRKKRVPPELYSQCGLRNRARFMA